MFIIKSRRRRGLALDEPIKHESHKRPVTRRDFLAQGFITGTASVIAPTMIAALLKSQRANAFDPVLDGILHGNTQCNVQLGSGKVPFICFDLAGGANIAGSNVLVGGPGGQLDFLSTQGYSKLGLPGNMLPNNATTNFVDVSMGIAFHADSAWLRGIKSKASPAALALVNGIVIPARSENDTSNNPHNPMYGLAKAGAQGDLLTLIGSQNSDSGGNSMAPAMMIDPKLKPTKIDRGSDVAALGSVGPPPVLGKDPTIAVNESIAWLSGYKLGDPNTDPDVTNDPVRTGPNTTPDLRAADLAVKKRAQCAYIQSSDTTEKGLNNPTKFDVKNDPVIQSIFPGTTLTGEFEKTASVMKMVVPGLAGAGTISMGGYDYHTGDRSTGELRDERAGQCIGAVIEYAHQTGSPVMIYVFSDGSLNSNGRVDDSVNGRGKGEWTGDNQSTAASVILVYNPNGRPAVTKPGNQIGWFSKDGDVVTSSNPGGNSVNLLVHMVILNYMALNGEAGQFSNAFGSVLGSNLDQWIGFAPLA